MDPECTIIQDHEESLWVEIWYFNSMHVFDCLITPKKKPPKMNCNWHNYF